MNTQPRIVFLRRVALHLGIALIATIFAVPASASEGYDALRALDARLAGVAERLMTANVGLCENLMPATGLVLHSRDQYPAPDPAWFTHGNLAVAAVVPGSAADRAGIRADDAVLSIAGSRVSELVRSGDSPARDLAFDRLANQPVGQQLVLTIERTGVPRDVAIVAPEACRLLVEVLSSDKPMARSDGKVLQVSSALASSVDDNGLAVVVAHELAHAVMAHRRRLEAAGVSKGLFGEFGRNQQLNRVVEVEADLLSVHLLANAGLDPLLAEAFWRSTVGRKVGGGLMRSWTYPSASARGDLVGTEARHYLPLGAHPTMPMHLLRLRDRSFTEM